MKIETEHLILNEMKALREQLEKLNEITIINGGGRPVTYTRQDMFQLLYDRVTLKGAQRLFAYLLGLVVSLFSVLSFFKKG